MKIPLDAPARPVDVGGDFTLEFWMKTASGNASGACTAGGDNWINGNIIFDRDVFGNGDFGDYGVSLFGTGGRLAFGVDRLGTGTTICGTANVADGAWHHVAATRSTTTGQMRLFVDGQPDGAAGSGPTGEVSYRDGRSHRVAQPDPFLVIGAEKHDAGTQFPSYHGWIDEVRVSNVVRYSGAFTRAQRAVRHRREHRGALPLRRGQREHGHSTARAGGRRSEQRRAPGGRRPAGAAVVDRHAVRQRHAPTITLQQLTASLERADLDHPRAATTACSSPSRAARSGSGTAPSSWRRRSSPSRPIVSGGERGLLSVAFHPQYAQNGFFFVYYTDPSGNVDHRPLPRLGRSQHRRSRTAA